MISPLLKYHLITNFPKGYPLHKKVWANVIFFFSRIIIHPRKNLLTKKDLSIAISTLQRGDLFLAGNFRVGLSLLETSLIAHATMYIGERKFVHATGGGVGINSLHQMLTEYDTFAILRIPKNRKNRKQIIKRAINFAKKQIGKPYNFEFTKNDKTLFCTQLVNDSYLSAGYETGLKDIKKTRKLSKRIEKQITNAVDALRAIEFLKGNFEMVALSHNLRFRHNKLTLITQPAKKVSTFKKRKP